MANEMVDANGIDFGRLNKAEREVLRLLAEGHTAKSIANELGMTPAAVNERLREARRKTGAGSSRELARILKTQENRDDKFGMDGRADSMASLLPARGVATRASRRRMIAMTGFLSVAIAIAIVAIQQDTSSTTNGRPFSDSVVGDIFAPADPAKTALIPTTERDYDAATANEKPETVLRRLHAQVRSERGEQPVPSAIETRLAALYKQIHPMKLSRAPLRILCSDTLCEVATTTEVPTPEAAVQALLNAVQGATLWQRAQQIGLRPRYLYFGLHPKGDRAAYLGYWTRAR